MGFLNWIMKGVDTEETNTNIDFIDASELDNQNSYDIQSNSMMVSQDDRLENLRNLANMEKQNSVVVAPMQMQQPVYIPQAQRFEEPKASKQDLFMQPPPEFDSLKGASSDNFEDRLSKYMKLSEERLIDVKRQSENKRGGGYVRRG